MTDDSTFPSSTLPLGDDPEGAAQAQPAAPGSVRATGSPSSSPPLPFELRSLPSERGKSRLFLVQLPVATDALETRGDIATIARAEGTGLERIASSLLRFLSEAGHDVDHGFLNTSALLTMSEETALRVALLLQQTEGIRSGDKVSAIASAVADIPSDEVLYWVRKYEKGDHDKVRKAFRQMFVD